MDRLLMILILAFANNVYAQDFNVDFDNVTYIRNYDGDTINFDIAGSIAEEFVLPAEMIEKLAVIPNQIRLDGVDTPEMKPRKKNQSAAEKECEKRAAKVAKKYVATALKKASRIDLKACSKGKYYRMVCSVMYDGKNLALELLREKLAILYDGGTKADYNWCK